MPVSFGLLRAAPAWVIGSGASMLIACTVDDRVLQPAEPPTLTITDGSAGAGATDDISDTGDGSDAGGASQNGDGPSGQGGAAPDSPMVTTSTTSWSFDSDAALGDWQPEDSVEPSFSSEDADGSGDSGSLLVVNAATGDGDAFVSSGVFACMPVEAGVTYRIDVNVEIDADQPTGSGGFDVEFFGGTGCDGTLLDISDYLTATAGSWQLGEREPVAPDWAHSALFRLIASKRRSDPPFAVHFDDVRFAAQ